MTHYPLVVALPPTDPELIGDALDEAMAPFDRHRPVTPYHHYKQGEPDNDPEIRGLRQAGMLLADDRPTWREFAAARNAYGAFPPLHVDPDGRAYELDMSNPKGTWDSYEIGGRFPGFFSALKGHRDDARLIMGTRTWDEQIPDGGVDGGPRGLLDLDTPPQPGPRAEYLQRVSGPLSGFAYLGLDGGWDAPGWLRLGGHGGRDGDWDALTAGSAVASPAWTPARCSSSWTATDERSALPLPLPLERTAQRQPLQPADEDLLLPPRRAGRLQ